MPLHSQEASKLFLQVLDNLFQIVVINDNDCKHEQNMVDGMVDGIDIWSP